MANLLYVIAFLLVILWAVGYLGYHAGAVVHILLVLALIAVLIRLVRGDKKI